MKRDYEPPDCEDDFENTPPDDYEENLQQKIKRLKMSFEYDLREGDLSSCDTDHEAVSSMSDYDSEDARLQEMNKLLGELHAARRHRYLVKVGAATNTLSVEEFPNLIILPFDKNPSFVFRNRESTESPKIVTGVQCPETAGSSNTSFSPTSRMDVEN